MRRCTHCFRFHAGHPTFCAHCGRSFGVRICARGHANRRSATYCAECGSAELSTPAPPESLWQWLSTLALAAVPVVAGVAIGVSLLLAIVLSVNWESISGSLVVLVLLLGCLYWLTTLVPGPIKKVGKAVGRKAIAAMTNRRKTSSRRHDGH
ncbi:MAG TPA: hypothetical protein VI485_16120 [Vicinamibacterales bacterium]|nr:hypothetical protein [Vicinamibacterales bacterium]